ncbi:AAA family ATPase [Candidatus Woesebacteria bacterium]|nr:AAA family ATPase [Candidatus Woesebacteria bacterium]
MAFIFSNGSEYRKWDLHFHTPSSYDYKDQSTTNQQIIDQLTANEIRVVAITDHNTIDSSRFKELQTLAGEAITFLPGIELCTSSRGTDPIHIIGIFPENSDSDYVWNQLNVKLGISSMLHDGKKENEVYCDIKVASELIRSLGGLVTIHAGRKSNSIEEITNALPVMMAEKKDIAECVDIFEVGQVKDVEDYTAIVFPKIGKEYPLVICSDNHDCKTYEAKETLWIKADPTFEGLKQITYEPSRAYVGSEPPIHARVRQNPTKFIESVNVTKVSSYQENDGVWFKDVSISLNSEMVAIIGNKGGGKSAIADIIGYVGGAKTVIETDDASFLNEKKFRKNDLACNFTATLKWVSGDTDTENLQSPENPHTTEKVKYLPQHWFEELCNDLDGKKFNEELEKVVFSHLDHSEKIGHDSFAELIREKSQTANQEIAKLKTQLTDLNTLIVELLKKLHPDHKNELEEAIKQKQRELDAHNKTQPAEEPKPADDNLATQALAIQINQLNTKITVLIAQLQESVAAQTSIKQKQQKLSDFEAELVHLQQEVKELTETYDFTEITGEILGDPLFQFTYDEEKFKTAKRKLADQLAIEEQKHFTNEEIGQFPNLTQQQKANYIQRSIVAQLEIANGELKDVKKQLSKPQEKYQQYLEDKKKWETDKLKIEGATTDPADGTLNYLKNQLAALGKVVLDLLTKKEKQRVELTRQIFEKKHQIVIIYESIKQQVDDVLQQGKQSIDGYSISVDAGFQLSPSFVSHTIGHINLRAKGSYMETDNARAQIKKLSEQSNLQTFEEVKTMAQKILDDLATDNRSEVDQNNRQRYLQDQVKSPVEFLDYLFGLDYLAPNYQLKLDQKNLSSLSPGEKGALLLVFYLMLDQDDIPLVIDQPEDNLDNESVAKILVQFIKSAKHRRQIIMVTHNPNLAVVADAEQVIYVNIDKADGNTFSFISGSIENDEVNKKIVDVLEGTMPAFDKRRLRYLR